MKAIRDWTFRYCDREVCGVKDVKDSSRFELSLQFSRFFSPSSVILFVMRKIDSNSQTECKIKNRYFSFFPFSPLNFKIQYFLIYF